MADKKKIINCVKQIFFFFHFFLLLDDCVILLYFKIKTNTNVNKKEL